MRRSKRGRFYSTRWQPSTTRERRERLLKEIRETHTYGPSLPDLAVWSELSYNAAWRHLASLEKSGQVEVERHGHRIPIKIKLAV